jgi:hypothetical protein
LRAEGSCLFIMIELSASIPEKIIFAAAFRVSDFSVQSAIDAVWLRIAARLRP